MKLDYIHHINEHNENIIRLYDFKKSEAILFRDALRKTLIDNKEDLLLHTLDFIEVRNCYLTLRLHTSDEGILNRDRINFYCFLTIESYRKMLALIEPFCKKETRAYQWLYDLDTPTDFLFSPAGSW